jgi:hypothetical protein
LKTITHKSVIPIYAAGAVWLLASLFLPMYRLWHYLLYGVLAVGAYVVAQHFFPGTQETVAEPEAAPDSGDPAVDQMILSGRQQLQELHQLGAALENRQLGAQVARLEGLTKKIFAALEEDTSRLSATRKFLNYYLPTTVRLVGRYGTLEQQKVQGENITKTMEKIQTMLQTVEVAFQRQLDHLYQAEAMDISADIAVMQQMMAAEGLLENNTNNE